MTNIRQLLFGHWDDPYAGIEPRGMAEGDIQGWNSRSEVFAQLIAETKPKLICEVGSWKGASAAHMAGLSPDAELICVDTWLGSLEMWLDDAKRGLMNFRNGRAGVYEIFMQNMVSLDYHRRITPFPATSTMAATFFRHYGIRFDLIYIDASHETKEVFEDIRNYQSLAPVIFGDDYDWLSVRTAVDSFVNQNLRDWHGETRGEKWIIRRR